MSGKRVVGISSLLSPVIIIETFRELIHVVEIILCKTPARAVDICSYIGFSGFIGFSCDILPRFAHQPTFLGMKAPLVSRLLS